MNAQPAAFWVNWSTPAKRGVRCGAWLVEERANGRAHAVYEDCMDVTLEGVLASLRAMRAASDHAARLNRERQAKEQRSDERS